MGNMISFNTAKGHENFVFAKSDPNERYRNSTIKVDEQKNFWILLSVNNEALSAEDVAENVRVSFRLVKISDTCTRAIGTIMCDQAEPKAVEASLDFVADKPFSLKYYNDSGYMYSQFYKLHSDYSFKLGDEVMSPKGAMIGYKGVDGMIPGGENNTVTVSIRVMVDWTDETENSDVAFVYPELASQSTDVNCTYLGHSGFFMEFPTATFLFDYYQGELPPIRGNVPLYVFISHTHQDHFNRKALHIAQKHPKASVFLGCDPDDFNINLMKDSFSETLSSKIFLMGADQQVFKEEDGLQVKTLKSSDLGVAFLITYQGKLIYHAGDLAFWLHTTEDEYMMKFYDIILQNPSIRLESYEECVEREQDEFVSHYLEPLRGLDIDYGMLPMDPRLADKGHKTIESYLTVAHFKQWSPMHLWGNEKCVDDFVATHKLMARSMIGTTEMDGVLGKIKTGASFQLFTDEED